MRELTWKIEGLNVVDIDEARPGAVRSVLWRVFAAEGEQTATAYGEQVIEFDGAEEFTHFSDLKQDQVIEWVKGAMGEKGQALIHAEINRQLAIYEMPVLPWGGE